MKVFAARVYTSPAVGMVVIGLQICRGRSLDREEGWLLLKAGSAAVEDWRKENPDGSITADGATVRDLNLSGIDLSNSNLSRSNFIGCDLSSSNFSNASLVAAKFINCNVSSADFTGAKLNGIQFIGGILSNSDFGRSSSLSKIRKLSVSSESAVNIEYDASSIGVIDKFVSWEKLRLLAKVRLFLPAYLSLILTVFYLSFSSHFNQFLPIINNVLPIDLAPIRVAGKSLAILVGFFCLTVSATTFLACPSLVLEFSRARWIAELKQPQIFYDFAGWSSPLLRIICASGLAIGGGINGIILIDAILHHVITLVRNLS